MKISFIDNEHEKMFYSLIDEDSDQTYYIPLVYLLTMDNVTRKHIKQIYNFDEKCINPDCLSAEWITSSSKRTISLAFQMYTDNTLFTDNPNDCTISNIFNYSAEYNAYYINAIQIRYNIDND